MQGRSMNLSGDLNTTIQINDTPRPRPARRYSAIEPNRERARLAGPRLTLAAVRLQA